MLLQDRRVKRTQQALARALITLTLEKGYEPVTIREITEEAGVGYATFFRHYHDKDGLLQDVLDVVLNELTALLSLDDPANDSSSVGVVLFQYVKEHAEVVRVLLGSRVILKRLTESVTRQIAAEQQAHREDGQGSIPVEVVAHHIVTASIALIDWWLQHGMPYSPQQMGRIYRDLILEPTGALDFS